MLTEYNKPLHYQKLLFDIKTFLDFEKTWEKRVQNQIKIQIYWKIGERISEEILRENQRADYGDYLITLLSKDLDIDGSMLSRNLCFYRCYRYLQHISNDLTWSHYRKLITIDNNEVRRYYEVQAIVNRWSVRDLEKAISEQEHHIIKNVGMDFPTLPPVIPDKKHIFKESYDLRFTNIQEPLSEEKLEQGIIREIEKFLLELGYGFAFIGKTKKDRDWWPSASH